MDSDCIIVLGAGMAGLAATRRLVQLGHEPILIAPNRPVPSRGETLSPKALPLLDRLGWRALLTPDCVLRGEDRFSVWGSPQLRRSPGLEASGYHIDRLVLEAEMARCISHVTRFTQSATRLDHLPAGARVHLSDGQTLQASVLIDCTGRAAISSGPSAHRKRIDSLTAAWRIVDLPPDTDTLAATLIEATDLGWWYVSPVPGDRLMVGLFSDSDLLPQGASKDGNAWAERLSAAPIAFARVESLGLLEAISSAPPLIAPAATVLSQNVLEGRILRAGDAAAALDPLGANGIATALWSGVTAGEAALALVEGNPLPAQRYEQSFLEGMASQLEGQRALYRAESRFPTCPFWRRRQK